MIHTGRLGFSITSALSTAGKAAYNVASDPRVQATAAVVGTQYAPQQTAQVQAYARAINHNLRTVRRDVAPDGTIRPGQQMMPMPMPYDDGSGGGLPVQKSNFLVYAGIGAGALILLLLLKK